MGSGAQHCSISLLHSGSHDSGIAGLNVLFTIPPAVEYVLYDLFSLNYQKLQNMANHFLLFFNKTTIFIWPTKCTYYSTIMHIAIWFFACKDLPHSNGKRKHINLPNISNHIISNTIHIVFIFVSQKPRHLLGNLAAASI